MALLSNSIYHLHDIIFNKTKRKMIELANDESYENIRKAVEVIENFLSSIVAKEYKGPEDYFDLRINIM